MGFKHKSFDYCIDKGTFDGILCSKENIVKVNKIVDEIKRVTKKGFILVSNAGP